MALLNSVGSIFFKICRVSLYVCTCTHRRVWACMWRSGNNLGCHAHERHLPPLRQHFSMVRLPGRWAPGTLLFLLLRTGITSMLDICEFWDQTPVLMLTRQGMLSLPARHPELEQRLQSFMGSGNMHREVGLRHTASLGFPELGIPFPSEVVHPNYRIHRKTKQNNPQKATQLLSVL